MPSEIFSGPPNTSRFIGGFLVLGGVAGSLYMMPNDTEGVNAWLKNLSFNGIVVALGLYLLLRDGDSRSYEEKVECINSWSQDPTLNPDKAIQTSKKIFLDKKNHQDLLERLEKIASSDDSITSPAAKEIIKNIRCN